VGGRFRSRDVINGHDSQLDVYGGHQLQLLYRDITVCPVLRSESSVTERDQAVVCACCQQRNQRVAVVAVAGGETPTAGVSPPASFAQNSSPAANITLL